MKTNKDIIFKKDSVHLFDYFVPKGATVSINKNKKDYFWINPSNFDKNSLEHHDFTYYGFSVSKCDVEE